MTLIEILTAPYRMNCDCIACFNGTYYKMCEIVIGKESEALALLNDPELFKLLKIKNNADAHDRARFSILLGLVSDDELKLNLVQRFVIDASFDLALLSLSIVDQFEHGSSKQSEMQDSKNIESSKSQIQRIIKNAQVFRKFPELMEYDIPTDDTDKIIFYLREINKLGEGVFDSYFSEIYKDEWIEIIHVLFDEYNKTKDKYWVPMIQDIYAKVEKSKIGNENFNHDAFYELTNKILSEGNHNHLPFRTSNHGAKNIDEYLNLSNKINHVLDKFEKISSDHNKKLYNLKSKIEDYHKQIQFIQKEIENITCQIAHNHKSQNRISEIEWICKMNPLARLNHIIQNEKSIYYYPEFLLEDIFEYFDQLSFKNKETLKNKLATAKRGILKKVKLQLLEMSTE